MYLPATLAALLILVCAAPGRAQTGLLSQRSARFWTHTGYYTYLALGIGAPLLDGSRGRRRAAQTFDAVLATGLTCQLIKWGTRQERPDQSGMDSFPSGHTTAVFAIAATQARFRPRQGLLWALGATLIADSRVVLRRHHSHDVVAGAILGAEGPRLGIFRSF